MPARNPGGKIFKSKTEDIYEPVEALPDNPVEGTPDGAASATVGGDPAPDARDAELASLKEALQAAQELKLRALADMENIRRRSRLDQEDAARYGAQSLITDLLPALDNMERALTAQSPTVDSLKEGVTLTLRQLHDALARHGVEVVPAVGQPFDAQHHEAIGRTDPTPEFPAGAVSAELQKGYTLRGRLLRPAMVQVSQDA